MSQEGKYSARLAGLLAILFLLPSASFALDSSTLNPPLINALDTSSNSSCSYYRIDIFAAMTTSTGWNPLKFYNNGVSLPATPPVPCAGTYQMTFMVELKMPNVATLVVTPLVQDILGTVLYPAALGAATTTLYPQCNNVSYSTTPYCSVGWVTGSVQVTLPVNDQVGSPWLMFSTTGTMILGGQFELLFLHS